MSTTEEYECAGCGAKIEVEDAEELLGKGWHIVKADDGPETVLCPACFRLGKTLQPGEAEPA